MDQRIQGSNNMNETRMEEGWKHVEAAIIGVQMRRPSPMNFEQLNSVCFRLVTQRQAECIRPRLKALVEGNVRDSIHKTVAGSVDGSLLEVVNEQWGIHRTAMLLVKDVLFYLEQSLSGEKPIHELGIEAFKTEVLGHVEIVDAFQARMLSVVAGERAGQAVEWNPLRESIQVLLAISELDGNRSFYEQHFETEFLDDTREFHRREGQRLAAGSSETYFRGVQRCYEQEENRASRYLDSATRLKVIQILDSELLDCHMIAVMRKEGSGMLLLFENQSIDVLRIAYNFSPKLLDGRPEMGRMLGSYIETKASEIFKSAAGARATISTEVIVELIELDNTLKRCIAEAFDGDGHFKEMLEKSFYRVMGTHAESPQLLSSYIGERIKVAETDAQLAESVTMFKYLAEKDAFERQYVKDFGRRLLAGKYNAEMERSLIQQFKTECGSAYTDKMEQMFKDIDISASHNFEFRDQDPEGGDKITVQVLKSVNWRLPDSRRKLPPAMERWFNRFNAFYNGVHNGRRLGLCTSHGTVELKASFGENQQLTKTLIVPTGLACVLAEFNQHHTRTFEQLLKDTELPERDLRRYLQSVSMGAQKQRIMLRKGQGEVIAPDDEFSINESFTCKSTRVVIQLASITAQTTEEQDDFKKQLDEGRKVEIEAAIVRTMKARQTLEHNSLVVEVVNQLAKRFQPDQTLIKRCIEDLIEREYIQRSPEDQRIYRYVA